MRANINDLPIAMTDVETTGDVFGLHEILEIGLVVFDQKNFEILDTYSVKVKPLHIENAVPAALLRNGYEEKNWKDAIDLHDAMVPYSEKTKGSVFCGYNATFDWGFINHAFRQTGLVNQLDYRRLDLLSMMHVLHGKEIQSLSLDSASKFFGLPEEAMPHSALNGAMQAYELYKKLFSR